MVDSTSSLECSDRFNTAMILRGIKLLIAAPDKLQSGIGMVEQLSINLSQADAFLSQRDMKDDVLAIQGHYRLDGEDPSDNKWNFVRKALVLFVMLCRSLKEQKPMVDGKDLPPILSVGDEETVRNVLHFISLLGIYPYLSTDVGISLQARTKCDIGCIKSSLSFSMRNFMLYSCLNVLHDCLVHEIVGPYIISSSVLRCDILTALIQIIHCSSVKVQAPLSDCSLGYCKDWLEALIARIGNSVLMKDLLVLQNRRSLKWFNAACGVLLSRKLMEKNGLLTLLNAVFQDAKDGVCKPSDIWLKCNAISKVVSRSPSQAKSASNYYEQICPQVLLLMESEDDVLVMVSSCILSLMISCHYDEAMQYLILPLFSPLLSLTYEECLTISCEKLSSCLITLDKVLTVSKPGSAIFGVAAEFLPLLFMLLILQHEQQQYDVNVHMKRLPIKKILKKVFKMNDFAIQLQFFHQLLRISYAQSPSIRFKTVPESCVIVTKDDNILLKKNIEGSEGGYEAYSEVIVKLLMDSDIASSKLIGTVLSSCVECIASLVTNKEHHPCNKSSIANQNQLFLMKDADDISFVYSTVVLYVAAAICENITEKVLDEVNLSSLVQSVINIIKQYAAYVLEKQEIRVKEDCNTTLIFGGNATLSIAFGLLSAILSANKNIPTSIRPLLFGILPQLETLSQKSDIPEYADVTREIQICIVTLGAVWSESSSSRKDTQKQTAEVLIVGKESSSRISEFKGVVEETVLLSKPSGFSDALEKVFKMLEDPLIPVQGHGLIELARLIERKDCCVIEHKDFVLDTLNQHLQNQDSYIYMNAIRGLIAMASIDASKVISLLCSHYTCYKSKGLEDQPSDENTTIESSEEWIMKVGETIVKVTQSLGEVLPFHCDQLVSAFLINVKHPESLVRASALSNLAEVLSHVGIKYTRVENEILNVLSAVLKHESCNKVKQAAILVIKRVFNSAENSSLLELPDSILQMYRLLKHVESTDSEISTRICAQDTLSELNKQMKEKVFPVPKMTKKITVLPD